VTVFFFWIWEMDIGYLQYSDNIELGNELGVEYLITRDS